MWIESTSDRRLRRETEKTLTRPFFPIIIMMSTIGNEKEEKSEMKQNTCRWIWRFFFFLLLFENIKKKRRRFFFLFNEVFAFVDEENFPRRSNDELFKSINSRLTRSLEIRLRRRYHNRKKNTRITKEKATTIDESRRVSSLYKKEKHVQFTSMLFSFDESQQNVWQWTNQRQKRLLTSR